MVVDLGVVIIIIIVIIIMTITIMIINIKVVEGSPDYWLSPLFGIFILSGVFGNCLVCLAISTERCLLLSFRV